MQHHVSMFFGTSKNKTKAEERERERERVTSYPISHYEPCTELLVSIVDDFNEVGQHYCSWGQRLTIVFQQIIKSGLKLVDA